jgi:hypothetical protein
MASATSLWIEFAILITCIVVGARGGGSLFGTHVFFRSPARRKGSRDRRRR